MLSYVLILIVWDFKAVELLNEVWDSDGSVQEITSIGVVNKFLLSFFITEYSESKVDNLIEGTWEGVNRFSKGNDEIIQEAVTEKTVRCE